MAMEEVRHSSVAALRVDRAFHVGIASIIGNPVVERLVGELFDQRMTPYFGRLAEHFEDAESWRAAVQEHRAIRNALAARDAALAREALRRHLERSQERFSRSFGEGEAPPDPRESALPPALRRVAIRSL
jgi:DNA-binding GntR family transcriptional regulator